MPFTRFVAATCTLAMTLTSCTAQTPGQAAGQVTEPPSSELVCARSSNCVSSLGTHGLLPLRYAGTPAQGMALLQATLARYSEATVVQSDALRLQAIFTTLLGFRDQVDFRLDTAAQQIHYRSRSLVGLYDFGKNRSRMLDFSERFADQANQALAR